MNNWPRDMRIQRLTCIVFAVALNLAVIYLAILSAQKSSAPYRDENTLPVFFSYAVASKTGHSHEIQTKPSSLRVHAARLQLNKAHRKNVAATKQIIVSESHNNLVSLDAGNFSEPNPMIENFSVRWNDHAIQAAIKDTLTATREEKPPRSFTDHRTISKQEKFAAAIENAAIPNCMDPDALKHHPAKLGGVELKGLLALPSWIHAAATGKCK